MAKKAPAKAAKGGKKSKVRKSAPTRRTDSTNVRGIVGIVLLCLGLLALVCQFVPSQAGLLRQCMRFVRGLGGSLCLLLPMICCWAGVVLVFFANKGMNVRLLSCGSVLFLFVETFLQLFQIEEVTSSIRALGQTPGYFGFIAQSYVNASQTCRGGGFIGALLSWPLHAALDIWGSVIVLFCACVIVLMVMTGISFGGVGMALSEWLDDWRVDAKERREEKRALREKEEEEALERELVLAEERRQKRAEREREQAEREARLREQDEARRREEAMRRPAPQPEEAPAAEAPRRRTRKRAQPQQAQPELELLRQQSEAQMPPYAQPEGYGDVTYMPGVQPQSFKAPVQKKRASVAPGTLFIERQDAFARPADEEMEEKRQGNRSFTMEEAENAFLYGMNGQRTAAQPAQSAQPTGNDPGRVWHNPDAAQASGAPVYQQGVYQQPVYQEPVQQEPAYEEPVYQQPVYQPPVQPGPVYQEPVYQQPVYQEPMQQEPVYEEPVYQQPAYDEPEDVQPEDDVQIYPEEEPDYEAHDEPEEDDELPPVTPTPQGGSVPSSIPAHAVFSARPQEVVRQSAPQTQQGMPQGQNVLRPKGQDVLEAQRQRPEDQVIVQLRGNRLDGTPMVMPRKEIHEGPEAPKEEYNYPPLDLLDRSSSTKDPNQRMKDEEGARKLLSTLESFGVTAKLTHVTHGPAITRYEIQPAPGVKVSRIVNLVDDIALNMASDGVRIEAPIPGKPAVGIEIPNEKIEMVSLRDVLESIEMQKEKSPTAVALGKGISGSPVVADMAKMPHVLIAGATGSGKSVCINTIINSVIYRASPKEVRLILIDPKVVELSVYNGIPHLLVPVVTDPKKASAALAWAVVEMEHRYKRFETMGVRDIRGYNKAIGPEEEPMAKIIVIIDELADLMMVAPGEVEESICRLAQLARAAGIHLVIATQRPSVNVITGVIKANIPSRIAFAVSSQIDSRTILDSSGAEKLLGKGDMLYAPQGAGKPTRVQGCFVSDDEVQRIVDYVKGQHTAEYNEDVMEQMNSAAEEDKAAGGDAAPQGEPVDEMLAKAIELAIDAGQVSISMLQRRLRVGYARAGRLVDEMTMRGITAEAEGPTKPRTVLISREEWRRMQENQE